MSLPFSFFLALKYLRPKRSYISVISVISVLGVMLGVAVLIIVLSVMSGFDEMWRKKILDFDAHITVTRSELIEDASSLAARLEKERDVAAAAPFVQGLVFVQHDNAVFTPFLRGIDPDAEKRVSLIPGSVKQGSFVLGFEEAVIGSELAARLRARVGDKLLVYSPQSFLAGDELSLPMELRITGIFNVGMWEYDVGFMLVSMPVAWELFRLNGGAHGIRVMTDDPLRAASVAARLDHMLQAEGPDFSVRTWMELNRQLFDALKVEKSLMFFLLVFIVLVAAFGIANTLIVVVVQKRREIGLLRALGFSTGSVMRVFFWMGTIQGLTGTILGIGFGLVVLQYRNHLMRWMASVLNMELLPKELYHLSEIPARTCFWDVAIIALLAMLICTFAGALAAHRAARLDPATALRYE